MNKRDELAKEMYSEDQLVLANQFKLGWDMCENEYNTMSSINGKLARLVRVYLDEPSMEILQELKKAVYD